MKMKYILPLAFAMPALLWSCNDDEELFGNPVIDYRDAVDTAHFGDSLPFTVNAADAEVPLSTLKAQLYYGEEMVEEVVIRTKESGKDYSGKIYMPYFANVPDGTATLKLVLQNINFTITEQEYSIKVSHADYAYLTLKGEDGSEYRMDKTAADTYAVTDRFPQKMKAYVVTPKVGSYGNELVFGYENSEITVGGENPIPFSSARAGKFTIQLNTRTFEASPFVVLKLNDQELEAIDDDSAKADMSLTKGQTITLDGFSNIGEWWIDSDWFTRNEDGTLTFTAMSGNYRIIANSKLQYFRVETLLNGEPASLQPDGTGALWVIGEDFGKPSVGSNATGWVTEKAVCMAPVADKVYQMTLVGGKTINLTSTNFKFFGEAMGWGDQFGHDRLSTTSTLIGIGDGIENAEGVKHDDGNLYLLDGVTLKENVIYIFKVDFTAGVDKGVLTVTEGGEQAFQEKPIYCNGEKMTTSDNSVYTILADLTQGQKIEFNTVDGLSEYYIDPDFMSYDEDNDELSFVPVNGRYKLTLDKSNGLLSAQRYDGDKPIALSDDCHGAIYIMGWGSGSPSLDYQYDWANPDVNAFGMAEVADKVYRFTGVAGPEHGSIFGQRFRYDYINIKFYHQKAWGDGKPYNGEFNPEKGSGLTLAPGSEALVKLTDSGNLELASGASLEEGATYEMTIDLTGGITAGVLSFVKK